MSLESTFDAAVVYIRGLPPKGRIKPTNGMKLKFYSCFKQASEGSVKGAQPSRLKVVARAKWDAWKDLGDMTKDEAMKAYVDELNTLDADWQENARVGATGQTVSGGASESTALTTRKLKSRGSDVVSATEATGRLQSLQGRTLCFVIADALFIGFYLFFFYPTALFLPSHIVFLAYAVTKFVCAWRLHKGNRIDRDRYTALLFKSAFAHAVLAVLPPVLFVLLLVAPVLVIVPLGLILFGIVELILAVLYCVALLCVFIVAPAFSIYAAFMSRSQLACGIVEIEEQGSYGGPIELEGELGLMKALNDDFLGSSDTASTDSDEDADRAEKGQRRGCFACLG